MGMSWINIYKTLLKLVEELILQSIQESSLSLFYIDIYLSCVWSTQIFKLLPILHQTDNYTHYRYLFLSGFIHFLLVQFL